MSLEEHTLEQVGERCEECGAKLTEREVELALERGGPTLCAIHLADVVEVEPDDDAVQPDTGG
jgi:hypothetical protein